MNTFLIVLLIISNLLTNAQENNVIKVSIKTEFGDMIAELYQDKAPITVNNFLMYVDSGYYSYGSFIRTVTPENQKHNKIKIDVIQAEAHQWFASSFEPIEHETTELTGIKHEDGVMSMARYTPGTATSSFFICVGSQPELDLGGKRNPDGQGFSAFGKIIDGMNVVKKIHESKNSKQALMPPILIISISRL